jgi:hypothetical protein
MTKTRKKVTTILFIGNSFTARNDLPGLISRLAAAAGLDLETRLLSIGGASLRTHWNKGEALAAIKTGKFVYVVLQEQSTLPIKNAVRMRENVLLFDSAIRAAGSKTVLYMTWARQHSPDKQRDITEAYRSIGRDIDAFLVPVGEVWKQYIRKHEDARLYEKDQSHPTIAGSFLAACVFVSVLFGLDPLDLTIDVPGLDANEVRHLQRAGCAAPIVKQSKRSQR